VHKDQHEALEALRYPATCSPAKFTTAVIKRLIFAGRFDSVPGLTNAVTRVSRQAPAEIFRMNHPILLMLHVAFGVLCLVGSLWVFVETLNATEGNLARIRRASLLVAFSMWIAYVIAGYWYVAFYPHDKAIILKGPWPFSHNIYMETKEHLVMMLLLLSTYLPIAAAGRLATNLAARSVVLWTSGLVVVLALIADGFGGIIAMGVKVALLVK